MKKLSVNILSESVHSVQAHGVHTAYTEMVTALKKASGVSVTEDDFSGKKQYDIVHLHTLGSHMWKFIVFKKSKVVVSAHIVPESFVGSIIFAKYWLFAARWYIRWFYNRADLLIAVSEDTKNQLLRMKVKSRVEVIDNFIDKSQYSLASTPRDDIRTRLKIPENAFVVVGAGQVQPRKRIDSFVAVAQLLPDMHFVWLGGLPFGALAAEGQAMKKTMAHQQPNVHFTGIVEHDDMVSYYHASDMFWLPSDQETFGLVVVEAAASGLPILLRSIPDYSHTFQTDACYGATDQAFADQITRLKDDPHYYKTWRQHADSIANRYDSAHVAQKLISMYRSLL